MYQYCRVILFTKDDIDVCKNLRNVVIIEKKKNLVLSQKFQTKLESYKNEREKTRFLSDIYVQNTFIELKKKINEKISYIIVNPPVDEIGFYHLIQGLKNLTSIISHGDNYNYKFILSSKAVKKVNTIQKMMNSIIHLKMTFPKDEKYKFIDYIPYFLQEKDEVFKFLNSKYISMPYNIFDCSKDHNLNKVIYVSSLQQQKKALLISYKDNVYIWVIDELCLYKLKKENLGYLSTLICNSCVIPIGYFIVMNNTIIFYVTGYTGRYETGNFMEFSCWFENEAQNNMGIITISKKKYNLYFINYNIHIYVPKLLNQSINLNNDDNLDIDLLKYNICYDLNLNEKIKK
jgi:hypothetical protein